MADGAAFRDSVLERYDFTPAAQAILKQITVEVENPGTNLGGGFWSPSQNQIELRGEQDEACLHELAHAWADESGFYTDSHPEDPGRNARHARLQRDVERAARETDPRYQRVAFLCWEYTWGNPNTGFEGMAEADWERFAGLASGVMGDTRLMPPYLRRWYDGLFGGNPRAPGPSNIPNWAPRDWRPGTPPPNSGTEPGPRFEGILRYLQRIRQQIGI